MVVKGLIIDLDGTLIDSIPFFFKHHQQVCKEFDIKLTRSFFEQHCNGRSQEEFYKDILMHHDGNLKRYKDIILLHQQTFKNMKFNKIKAFPHVRQILKILHKDHRIVIATSSPKSFVDKILISTRLLPYADAIITRNNVKKTKPDPAIFLLAWKKTSVKKSECLIIEDSISGVIAAKRAGIRCLCLLTSNKRKDIPSHAQIARTHKSIIPLIREND